MSYEAFPLRAGPERADVVSKLMRGIFNSDNVFLPTPGCEEKCGESDCEACQLRLVNIARVLGRDDAIAFEVWNTDEMDLRGTIYFTDVRHSDATGHFIFFDRSLGSDKVKLMQNVIDWAFSDHDGWSAKQRLTVEIPEYAFTLARFVYKKLGFGGPFKHELGGKEIEIEGLKRYATKYQDEPSDVMILGLVNPKLNGSA